MKHWDGRDVAGVAPRPLTPRERERLRQLFEPPAHRRPERASMGSVIGLVLSLGVLVGLAWMLSPSDPVSSKLLN